MIRFYSISREVLKINTKHNSPSEAKEFLVQPIKEQRNEGYIQNQGIEQILRKIQLLYHYYCYYCNYYYCYYHYHFYYYFLY